MATKLKITKKDKFLKQEVCFQLLNDMIQESLSGVRTKNDGKQIKKNSLNGYKYLQKNLLEFTETTNFEWKIFLDNQLTLNQKNTAKRYYSKFYKAFTNFMVKKGAFDNYIGLMIKSLRSFFNYLEKDRYIQVGSYHKSFYIPKEEIPIIALSIEQLQFIIYNEEFNQKIKAQDLEKTRDIFVFGCCVALRISDLFSLTNTNLTIKESGYYIHMKSQKTGVNTSVKIPDYAEEIVKKYANKKGKLLPQMTPEWFNKKLRRMGVFIPDNFELIKTREQNGKQIVRYQDKSKKLHYKLSDHLSSHTMRKTAITSMLHLGMPEHIVRRISGHSVNSRDFHRYVMLSQNIIDVETDKVYEKLKINRPLKK